MSKGDGGERQMLEPGIVNVGDARELAGHLAPQSVQCIVTSPPYFGLRDYGTATWEGGEADCNHVQRKTRGDAGRPERGGGYRNGVWSSGDWTKNEPNTTTMQYRGTCGKCGAVRVDKQMGMEATPDEFVANLVALFAALRPALRDDGTAWVVLGDSYGGIRGNLEPAPDNKHRHDAADTPPDGKQGTTRKQLLGMPWRFAFAMQADGWVLRSEITWAKKSCMPESVTDRPTSATEKIFLFSKSPRYYFDATAIAEPASAASVARYAYGFGGPKNTALKAGDKPTALVGDRESDGTRNARNFWLLGPEPFPLAHFATFPSEIPRRAIRAGTSEKGACTACRAPWRRVVERVGERATHGVNNVADEAQAGFRHNGARRGETSIFKTGTVPVTASTGWQPSCRCEDAGVVPCVVLDPFVGSGTTAAVCVEEGRDWIGFDLDERATDWTAERLRALPVRSLFAAGG